uniref:LRRCT domain-containing protein n=1 Tax=Macrostomum lignano TaxID=282301 RepID=A0A1I8FJ13_9PLAT
SLADLSRVSVRINGLPNSDQLPAIVSLLKAARSAEQLEFTGPVRVLYLYQPLQSLPKLTHLKAACTTQQSDFELISELDNAKNKALIDVELHNCIWRNRSSVLLNNLASLVSAKYNGGRLDQLSVGEIKGLPNLRYLILLNCDLSAQQRSSRRGFSFQRTRLEAAGAAGPRRTELSWLPAGTFQGLGAASLRLDGNPLLRLADKPCIALCSLTSLRTLKFDAKLGKEDAAGVAATICNRIALNSTGNVRLLMQAGVRPQPLKLNCPPGNGVLCRQKRLLQPLRADGAEKKQEESLQQQQAQSHPNMALLIIFGAICLAHLAVTIALACFAERRHQNWRHRQADQLTAPAACVKNLLTSDEIGSFGLSEEAGGNGAAAA